MCHRYPLTAGNTHNIWLKSGNLLRINLLQENMYNHKYIHSDGMQHYKQVPDRIYEDKLIFTLHLISLAFPCVRQNTSSLTASQHKEDLNLSLVVALLHDRCLLFNYVVFDLLKTALVLLIIYPFSILKHVKDSFLTECSAEHRSSKHPRSGTVDM